MRNYAFPDLDVPVDVHHAAKLARKGCYDSVCRHDGFFRIMCYSKRIADKSENVPGYMGSETETKEVQNLISECDYEIQRQHSKEILRIGKPDMKYVSFCDDMKDQYMDLLRSIGLRKQLDEIHAELEASGDI